MRPLVRGSSTDVHMGSVTELGKQRKGQGAHRGGYSTPLGPGGEAWAHVPSSGLRLRPGAGTASSGPAEPVWGTCRTVLKIAKCCIVLDSFRKLK